MKNPGFIQVIEGITGIPQNRHTLSDFERNRLGERLKSILEGKTNLQQYIANHILSKSDEDVGELYIKLQDTITQDDPIEWMLVKKEIGIQYADLIYTKLRIFKGKQDNTVLNNISMKFRGELEIELGKKFMNISEDQFKKWFGYLIKNHYRKLFNSNSVSISQMGENLLEYFGS